MELAQYHELLSFAQFGIELDDVAKKRLARGERAIQLLKQPQHVTYSFVDQSLMLFLLKYDFLDDIEVFQIHEYASQFVSYIKSVYYDDIYGVILQTQDIWDDQIDRLIDIAKEFNKFFLPPQIK